MKKIIPHILIILCLAWMNALQAELPNADVTYNPSVKTILLFRKGFEMAAPVMYLDDRNGLTLAFDDLDADLKPYQFTILHCECDWTNSTLIRPEDYIDGNLEDRIDDYQYSSNTLVPYTHYSVELPTRDMKIKVSGNYILKVYTDSPENPAFTRRFMVVEHTPLGVDGSVHQTDDVGDRFSKQDVDFTIRYNGFPVYDPRQVKVVVTQNDRWDNAIRNISPKFVRNESLDYNYDKEISFNGGNEFRAFDIKSLRYNSERIRTIDKTGEVIKVILLDDERRTFKKYTSEKDINGRKLIKSEDYAQNSDIEADYVKVEFRLPFDALRSNGSMHILGALTDWRIDSTSKMDFDFEGKAYVKELLLKQGYYNYEYVFRDNSTGKADETLVEGNHWETENEYTIWVYFRENGGLFDRLIAVQNLNMGL
ncbi:MAG: DUF5103 domain-containing protein [Syntrophothermus sp.]